MTQSVDLILEFGEALHSYGAASYNLEQALSNISKTVGLEESEFFSTPTLMIASFKIDNDSKTYVKRVYPADVDLRKLSYLDELGDKIIEGEIDIEHAYRELKRIRNLKDPFTNSMQIAAYAIVGACAAIFFDAGLNGIVASAISGLLVGIVSTLLANHDRIKNFTEFLAAFLATLFASLIAKYTGAQNLNLTIIASIIVLIPGLSLTISITELATLNLASGTARLMQAILVFFKLAFGVALALQLLNYFNSVPVTDLTNHHLPLAYKSTALLFASFAFSVLFKIPLKYYFWVLTAGSTGYFISSLMSGALSTNIATFIAGFTVCLFANAFARWQKHPALLLQLPGLILIVPGSIGFKGLQFFVEKNTIEGINSVFDMFLIAIALVSGFLLANILLVPNRSL